MTVTFSCTGCGKRYKAASESAGKQIKCTSCGTIVRVPAPRNIESPQSSQAADEVACPHCHATCGVLPEWRGQTLECPTCKRRFMIPAPDRPQARRSAEPALLNSLDDGESIADEIPPRPRSAFSRASQASPWLSGSRLGTLLGVGLLVLLLGFAGFWFSTRSNSNPDSPDAATPSTTGTASGTAASTSAAGKANNSSASSVGPAGQNLPPTGTGGTHAADALAIPGADPSIPAWAGTGRGEPFDVREFLQSRSTRADNAAPLYLAALADLTTELSFAYPPEQWQARERQVKALSVAIGELADIDRLRGGGVPLSRIDEVLAGAKPGIDTLDEAQRRQACLFVTGLRYDSELPHAQAARQVARLAQLQIYRGMAKNDFNEVEQAVRRTLRLSRDLRPRGVMICQLVSMAMDAVVASAISDLVLGSKDLSVEQCDRLLTLIVEHQGSATDARRESFRMEYIMLRHSMAEVQAGRLPVDTLAEMREDPSMRKMDTKRVNWEKEVAALDQIFSSAMTIAAKPVRETATKQWLDQQVAQLKQQRSQFTLFFIPVFDQFQEAQARWETRLAGVQGLIAVRRYELAHGALPPDLDTARKETKATNPWTDAYSGQPMRFKVVNGKPVVYSVGSDLKDDGGTVDWNFGQNPGDFIFKIAPPPAPASSVPTARAASSTPADVKTLLQDLDSSSFVTRREAADALAKRMRDENQPVVARRLERLFTDHPVVDHALDALLVWGDKDSITPVKQLVRGQLSGTTTKTKALLVLVKLGDEDIVDVVAEALGDIKGAGIDVRPVLEQMGPLGEKAAIKILAGSDPWPTTKREVVKFIETYSKKNALSPESVAVLFDMVRADRDHETVRPVIAALGTVKEERVADFLATGLDDFWYAKEAKAALIAMGPAAEKSVAKYLKHQKPEVRFVCCEILAVIGTKKSVSALRPLVANNPVGQAAKSAIDAINERAKAEN